MLSEMLRCNFSFERSPISPPFSLFLSSLWAYFSTFNEENFSELRGGSDSRGSRVHNSNVRAAEHLEQLQGGIQHLHSYFPKENRSKF